MAEPTAEEQARIDEMRATLGDLPEGVEIDFQVIDPVEMPALIADADAAVFLAAKGFGYYQGDGLPVLPAIELATGDDWLEQAVRDGRATCGAYGIGNAIEGVEVPLFASFQLTVDGHYTPVMVWLADAPTEWVDRAMSRFMLVWPVGDDGQRAWIATGQLERYREGGLVVPPNIGRNDRCPCGSGKKFKRCHGG